MKRMMLLLGCIFALGLFSCKTDDEEVCILVNDSEMITALEVGQSYILRLSNGFSANWAVSNAAVATLSSTSGVSVNISALATDSVTITATANGKTYIRELQIIKNDGSTNTPNVFFTNLSKYKVVVYRNGLNTEIATVEAGGTKTVYVSPGSNEITFHFRYSYCIINDDDNGTIWMDVVDNDAYTCTVEFADGAQETVQKNIPAPKNPKFDAAYLKVENQSTAPVSLYNGNDLQKLYNQEKDCIQPWHSGLYKIPLDTLFEDFKLVSSSASAAVAPFSAESGVLYTCEFVKADYTVDVCEEIRLGESGTGSLENDCIVHHFLQNTDRNTYTLKETETLTGISGAKTIDVIKNFTGFTAKALEQGTIFPDGESIRSSGPYEMFEQETISAYGSTVIDVYYDRNEYSVIFNANNGTGCTTSQVFYYGVPQKLNRNTFPYSSYIFIGWECSETDSIVYDNQAEFCGEYTSDVTLYAKWSIATADTIKNIDLTYITGEYTVKVVGDIDQDTLNALADKMKGKQDIFINLDLSEAVLEGIYSSSYVALGVLCGCPLYSIALPKTLKIIGQLAFSCCSNLKSIEIIGVETIGEYAFRWCKSLSSITVDAESIKDYAFSNCTALTSVIIGKNVYEIGWGCFLNCDALTSVQFEDTEGWYVKGAEELLCDVTDAAKNAQLLKDRQKLIKRTARANF